ncbi:MAG: hypothetical protein AAFO97_05635 [Pseudomonadota bacterium]
MFSSQTDHVRNAAKLLTAVIAFGASPGTKSGITLYDAAKKLAGKPPKGLKAMSGRMADLAQTTFDGFTHDLPQDAPILFEQMIEATLPAPELIAQQQMQAARIATAMASELKDRAHLADPMPQLFHDIVTPVLAELCKDKDFAADLTPAFMQEVLTQGAETAKGVNDIQAMLRDLMAGNYVSLDSMKALAATFGEHEVSDQASLERFLKLKAEEYSALKSEVDAIGETYQRLSNLKAAAQDAINRVDLDEVEELLSRVQEVELEEAAKTAELRANNALLRGLVEQAYRILNAAADSFAAVDPLEPTRRKVFRYAELFGRHGMRYGGSALSLSVEMMRKTATDSLKQIDGLLWGAAKNAEAIGLRNLGNRTAGSQGAQLLADAVTAYRAGLEVYTRADHPVDWATTQNNLAAALGNQGSRTDGPEGAQLLANSVSAFRAALEVRTRADHPVQWAMTQNNLANALREQGTRTEGPTGAQLLADAVAAYRAALEVRTRADHLVQWAMTQNNLAVALKDRGIRTNGRKGALLLADAVTAYRAALEVRTRADHPVHWADTQENIAIALQARAARPDAENPRADLTDALAAVNGALEVYDPEHTSYNHSKATRLRDAIQAELDALPD